MAENPVIRKFGDASRSGAAAPSAEQLQTWYEAPAYTGPRPGQRYLTLDDVVQRTGAMLAVLFAAGAVAWLAAPSGAAGPVLIVSLIGGLGLGLYISFTMRANAALCLLDSAFEGVLLGTISKLFENAYPGIVVQALTGTVMVAVGMLFVYKIGAIRVTPRFTRVVVGAMIGLLGLMVVNGIAYFFTPNGLGLRSGGSLAIVFSLVCIVVAAMNLVLDFDMIERAIRNGADQKFAWFASFGLMVTLIWLYLEILRLLGNLRNN
jgi:uncharacterized YccA/Bax inhibitor family protein